MRYRRFRMLAVVAACAVACGMVSSADAAPKHDRASVDSGATASHIATGTGSTGSDADSIDYGIPPFSNPDTTFNTVGGTFTVSTEASKLLTTIDIKGSRLLGYLRTCAVFYIGDGNYIQTCCANTTATSQADCGPPTPDQPRPEYFAVPRTSADDSLYPFWLANEAPLWVESPAGVHPRFGTFADVKVSTLAFGSVPVTATVKLRQLQVSGQVQPLTLNNVLTANTPSDKWTVHAVGRYPSYDLPAHTDAQQFTEPYLIDGRLDLRLTDVRVDGVPVNVGPSCRTTTPATLSMASSGGQYPPGPTEPRRGRTADFLPLANGTDHGSVQGNIAIPTFEGCKDGTKSLDKLLTALVSGQRNPLEMRLPSFGFCTADDAPRDLCPSYPSAQSAASKIDRSTPALPRMTDRAISSAKRALAALSPTVRASVLASMSLALRRTLVGP